MCGRFSVNTPREKLEETYDTEFINYEPWKKTNIPPSLAIPTVTNEGEKVLEMMQWGMKPKWYKHGIQFNVRSETIRDKPYYHSLFDKHRCLIPATSYFEWKKDGKNKIPFEFSLKKRPIFSLAGVWFENDGKKQCAIITSAPNNLASKYHSRMPVILNKDNEEEWLNEDNSDKLLSLLGPYKGKDLNAEKAGKI